MTFLKDEKAQFGMGVGQVKLLTDMGGYKPQITVHIVCKAAYCYQLIKHYVLAIRAE